MSCTDEVFGKDKAGEHRVDRVVNDLRDLRAEGLDACR
jgi:hypothetical protein